MLDSRDAHLLVAGFILPCRPSRERALLVGHQPRALLEAEHIQLKLFQVTVRDLAPLRAVQLVQFLDAMEHVTHCAFDEG